MKMEIPRELEVEDVVEDILEQFFEENNEETDDSDEHTSGSEYGGSISNADEDIAYDTVTESQYEYDEDNTEEQELGENHFMFPDSDDDDDYEDIYDFLEMCRYESELAANDTEPEEENSLSTPNSTHSFIAQEIRKINETYPLWAPPENVPPIDFNDKTWTYDAPVKQQNDKQFDAHKIEEANRRVGAQFIQEVNRGIYGSNENDPVNNSYEYYNAAQNYALSGLGNENEFTHLQYHAKANQSNFSSYTATSCNNGACIAQGISMTQTSTTYSMAPSSSENMQRNNMNDLNQNPNALNNFSSMPQQPIVPNVTSNATSHMLLIEQMRVLNTQFVQQQQPQTQTMPVNFVFTSNAANVPPVYNNPLPVLPFFPVTELFPTTMVAQRAITGGTFHAHTMPNPLLPALPSYTTAGNALNANNASFRVNNCTFESMQALYYPYMP